MNGRHLRGVIMLPRLASEQTRQDNVTTLAEGILLSVGLSFRFLLSEQRLAGLCVPVFVSCP